MRKQSGFSGVELVITILVVAVIAGAGWMVYRNNHPAAKSLNASTNNSANTSATASDVSSAPPIQSTSDLDNALKVLNQNDPSTANASDDLQLTSQSSF